MSRTTLIFFSCLVAICAVVLLVMNFAPSLTSLPTSTPPIFPLEQVKGMAVVHNDLPYTLNFDQQKIASGALLRAAIVKKTDYPTKSALNFQKIIFYRFDGPDVEVTPIQMKESNLVFSIGNEYYMELSAGELRDTINQSFDP